MKKIFSIFVILFISVFTFMITGCEKELSPKDTATSALKKGNYGIYFEDKKSPTDVIEIRNDLYNFFEQLSDRVILKTEVIPANCPTGCENLVYRMYPINKNENFNSYQFAIVDLVVNNRTTNTLSISFQHLDIYGLDQQLQQSLQNKNEFLADAQEVHANFVKEEGKWIMTSISLYEPYEEVNTTGDHYFPKSLIKDVLLRFKVEDTENISNLSNEEVELRGPYNRTTAKNYAKGYTINNNSTSCNGYNNAQYQCFSSNDCSNLVSQALYSAGMTFANPYNSSGSSGSWWYKNNGTSYTSDDTYSISWSTANGLYNHLINSGRGAVTTNLQSIAVGDVVFAKWVHKDSGGACYHNSSYDHAMIVTALVLSGPTITDLKLTYHTNDRVDKLLYVGATSIVQQSSFWDCTNYPTQCITPIITLVKMDNTF